MMDHDHIEIENVAERYVIGRLSREEEEVFEEHYLDCPQCLERLELTRELHRGLGEIARFEVARAAVTTGLITGVASRLLRRGWVSVVLGLVLVAGLVLPWVVLDSGDPEAWAPRIAQAPLSLSPTRSAALRDEAPAARLTLGQEPGWHLLSLSTPPQPRADAWKVRLVDPAGEAIWESEDIASDGSHRIRVSVHSSSLSPGLHVLELTPADTTPARPVRYSFLVEAH